jgi:WD40 repeat protein
MEGIALLFTCIDFFPHSKLLPKRLDIESLSQQTAQKLSQSQRVSQIHIRRRSFLIGLVSTVATCVSSSAITAFLYGKQNVVVTMPTHSLIGNTPTVAPSAQVPSPAGATILSKPLYTYHGHEGTVTAVAWSPQGEYIASAGTVDSSVQVWNANTGNIILITPPDIDPTGKRIPPHQKISVSAFFSTNNQQVNTLAWSSSGIRIASALGDDTVHIWNIKTGSDLFLRPTLPRNANTLAWSPDGNSIATVSGNVSVQVRSVATGKLLFTYTGHTQSVLSLAWSPNGKYIASAGADGLVQVWDAAQGYTLVTYRGHAAEVNAVAWSTDSRQIASGGNDSLVQVWDAVTGRTQFTYQGHAGAVNTVAWQRGSLPLSGNEVRIASGGVDATVQVWSIGKARNTQQGQVMALQSNILMYRGHTGQVTSLTWSPYGQLIASGSEDGTVQIWQAM